MSEIAQRHQKLAAEFDRRVVAVPDTAWDNASPCAGWTARDVLRHVLETSYRDMPAQVGLTVTIGSVDDDPVGAWRGARDQLQEILADPARAGLEYDGMFGRTSLAQTIGGFCLFDLLIHGWDIARATGGDETLPADEVHSTYQQAVGMGDMLRTDGVCGPAVPVPSDAPEQDRLLGLLGRDPRR
ncbi:TIGR03086 family metal-binding protein [Actinocatenispora comari]|uniref:Mycothiol-dependent maleylpyruvate isomerase metal-binding domain-containing protein n=1 Tax=Actinocatenispora comari TaxID=2807577 RepID=A0A8J4EJ55_9ACTN|nr:TIGR03086 family metal-binding protein [Actinocatenispora comari]GIL26782.1 hypothetical protein NUM_20360 [Actinocatenispora comari]